jgi:hypothetical protein
LRCRTQRVGKNHGRLRAANHIAVEQAGSGGLEAVPFGPFAARAACRSMCCMPRLGTATLNPNSEQVTQAAYTLRYACGM